MLCPFKPPAPGYRLYLTWDNQVYQGSLATSYGAQYAKNLPDGIRIYRADGFGGWSLIDQISASSDNYFRDDIDEQAGPLVFKVTSYNASGESFDAPSIEPFIAYKIARSDSVISGTYDIGVIGVELMCSKNPFVDGTMITTNVHGIGWGEIQITDIIGNTVLYQSFQSDGSMMLPLLFSPRLSSQKVFLCRVTVSNGRQVHK